LVKYLLLVVIQILVINPFITQEYSLQDEIPETIVVIIIINHHHISIHSDSNQ
jgi:branched-subunit amino acid transport protein AzlD